MASLEKRVSNLRDSVATSLCLGNEHTKNKSKHNSKRKSKRKSESKSSSVGRAAIATIAPTKPWPVGATAETPSASQRDFEKLRCAACYKNARETLCLAK